MARRKKNINSIDRREKKHKHSRRTEKTLNQKLLVIIASEGEKTERYYFDALFKILKSNRTLSPLSLVFAPHKHTNPKGVLEDLLQYRDNHGNSYKDYDYGWIVIDRDAERCGGGGHKLDGFNEAILRAGERKPLVKVAWSNPCFEIWYLLHFQYRQTSIDRDCLTNEALPKAMMTRYKKNDATMYIQLENKIGDAIRNARKLFKNCEGMQPAKLNPGTTVFGLVELLLQLQEK